MRGISLPPLLLVLVITGIVDVRPVAQSPTLALVDRFLAGEFDGVRADLARLDGGDFDDLLGDLRRSGADWTTADGELARPARALAAATFALEAGRAAARVMDWKWVQRVESAGSFRAPDAIWWKTPPRLIEWGCELLREQTPPDDAERLWHLAALAAAQEVSDYEFLIGSPWEERGNARDEILHLEHSIERFPEEPRFRLAQAIAIEWRTWPTSSRRTHYAARNLPDAVKAFREVMKADAVAPEAMVRLGAVEVRRRQYDDAIEVLEQADRLTRDPYLVYLAHYNRGRAYDAKEARPEAELAYRAALETIPRAQSATMALATLLVRQERPLEASALVEASLEAPMPSDPWREYAKADFRFWPYLIGRLEATIVTEAARTATGGTR